MFDLVHAIPAIASLCVRLCYHIQNTLFTTDIPLQLARSSFCLFFHDDASALAGRGVVQMSHFEVRTPLSPILRPLTGCWPLNELPTTAKRELLCWDGDTH